MLISIHYEIAAFMLKLLEGLLQAGDFLINLGDTGTRGGYCAVDHAHLGFGQEDVTAQHVGHRAGRDVCVQCHCVAAVSA